ncbi:HAD family hydrolase [Streptomyces cellulosae]|jgi:phosphoglycolate phosphatase|uniref:Phosphoglycolate phosphatase n=1 Tax=Streptomyces thermodiastaticus TaxID=44061 RepID=A0ABU0KLL4_9ACTN|nr:HAD family hydrolase [Streptomyces sp. McG7]MBT2904660.1 HAD family hydrolase [Streptomyces sp. McG8]MCX4475750.1 HAD family hydrolase [Streptomyces cellulosae]MDQ0489490.1 phosphoglycolate phosphatase [Streptomyces thermodiastaticus]MXQ59607.1 HAD-IA family hydrolase [Streptomyces sp. XHT-2]MYQ31303.1 HAD-IA family hydrolase [Streptomyces sp. SID4956]MYW51690.1 HAD-IA family hydrolase [Streptomyces sp. SID8376]THC59503.1 HAD family hydrolase [Streptomyces sp. Akac8]UVT08603.1 HAD family
MAGAVRAVLFDLDGTLADTPAAITEITLKVLAQYGHTPDTAAVRATVGRPLEQNLARLTGLAPEHPDVRAATAEYGRLFGAHVRSAGPGLLYPGVPAMLEQLRQEGLVLTVATSKVYAAAAAIVKLTGIDQHFAALAGDDTAARGKPHPSMALHLAEVLGLDPSECVVVGDGVPDVEMGLAAGMRVVGVSYGVSTAAELEEAGARTVVDTPAEVVPAVLAGRP